MRIRYCREHLFHDKHNGKIWEREQVHEPDVINEWKELGGSQRERKGEEREVIVRRHKH